MDKLFSYRVLQILVSLTEVHRRQPPWTFVFERWLRTWQATTTAPWYQFPTQIHMQCVMGRISQKLTTVYRSDLPTRDHYHSLLLRNFWRPIWIAPRRVVWTSSKPAWLQEPQKPRKCLLNQPRMKLMLIHSWELCWFIILFGRILIGFRLPMRGLLSFFNYILLVISSTVDVASPEPNAGLPDGVRVNWKCSQLVIVKLPMPPDSPCRSFTSIQTLVRDTDTHAFAERIFYTCTTGNVYV